MNIYTRTGRRAFLESVARNGLAAFTAACCGCAPSGSSTGGYRKNQEHSIIMNCQHDLKSDYDVMVFGSGPAGICAAVQAARAGASTLLVEKNGMFGGTTTVGGVNFPGLFHAWGRQIIAGIGWDIVRETVALSGEQLPDFSQVPDKHWKHQIRVNRALYASLACQALLTAGADILLHSMPAAVDTAGDMKTVTVCTKSGLREMKARVLIDGTGDANVLSMAGCSMQTYDDRQPGTLIARLDGYDIGKIDETALKNACKKALESGALQTSDLPAGFSSLWRILSQRGDNSIDVIDVNGRTSEGRTGAETQARALFLRIFRFLRRQPGFEKLKVAYMAPECGIRETVTIEGRKTVTAEDYLSGRIWPDAVCHSFYPIDWHRADGHGIEQRHLKNGKVATIPAGALLPRDSSNLIAAGRCISSDQMANSALRVQATCMATGQGAGAMAALAVREKQPVHDIQMTSLSALLREHGAIVPESG
jgi:hypothetical protein